MLNKGTCSVSFRFDKTATGGFSSSAARLIEVPSESLHENNKCLCHIVVRQCVGLGQKNVGGTQSILAK